MSRATARAFVYANLPIIQKRGEDRVLLEDYETNAAGHVVSSCPVDAFLDMFTDELSIEDSEERTAALIAHSDSESLGYTQYFTEWHEQGLI